MSAAATKLTRGAIHKPDINQQKETRAARTLCRNGKGPRKRAPIIGRLVRPQCVDHIPAQLYSTAQTEMPRRRKIFLKPRTRAICLPPLLHLDGATVREEQNHTVAGKIRILAIGRFFSDSGTASLVARASELTLHMVEGRASGPAVEREA
jgi:hypothetical protein